MPSGDRGGSGRTPRRTPSRSPPRSSPRSPPRSAEPPWPPPFSPLAPTRQGGAGSSTPLPGATPVPLDEQPHPWAARMYAVPPLHCAVSSLATTVSDSVVTPQSPAGPFGFGTLVDSPASVHMSYHAASPARAHPFASAARALPGHCRPLPGNKARCASGLAPSLGGAAAEHTTPTPTPPPPPPPPPRHRPSHLEFGSGIPETVDLTDPPTAKSSSSAYSSISTELMDLSNLRRSMQQNLRERPLGHGESDYDLESICESDTSCPSSALDRGRTVSAAAALAVCRASPQYLVVDTRLFEEFAVGHIQRSANVSIPTLLLNRLLKQTTRAGVAGWVSLTRYVSTTAGQALWDSIDLNRWLDIVVVGVNNDDTDAPYALADILEPLVSHGAVRVVHGGWTAVAELAHKARIVVSDMSPDPVVLTDVAPLLMPSERPIVNTALLVSPAASAPAPSQTNVPAIFPQVSLNTSPRNLPMLSINMPSTTTPRQPPKLHLNLAAAAPSSQERQLPMPRHSRTGKPKMGGLTIDVGSSRVPTGPQSALPFTGARSGGLNINTASSSALGARTSSLAPPSGEPWTGNSLHSGTPIAAPSNFINLPPPTPRASVSGSSIARLPAPPIEISTILPSFLFLGPEITTKADVDELKTLGVRRILNVAIECDDDEGLNLRDVFDKYHRIPMKDSIDESGVGKGIRDACSFLDDARLHSSPTYVHCKAGKSRSVTVVLAYLIHANAWTLHTSYQYVAERRHGISPNIGFVAELMEFETAELGHKQPGRDHDDDPDEPEAPPGAGGAGAGAGGSNGTPGSPRLVHREPRLGPRYTRESLPPEFGSEWLGDARDAPPAGGGGPAEEPAPGEHAPEASHRLRRKPNPDIEVRKNGQWVLRRTPVDRVTLQPGRRVSKAGLESMIMRPLAPPEE